MKKKEALITFVLAILVTLGSHFIARGTPCSRCKDAFYEGGWPLAFHRVGGFFGTSQWFWSNLLLDILFWFLVLAVGWWTVRKIKELFSSDKSGFTLIETLVVIAVLIILTAGGVVVWEKKAAPTPTPTPSPYLESCKAGEERVYEKGVFVGCEKILPIEFPAKLTVCQTNSDCPPSVGVCMPGNCPGWVCQNNRCVYIEDMKKMSSSKTCNVDSECVLMETKVCLGECESCKILDLSSPLFDAFNKVWCQQNQPPQKACPHCDIQRTNQQKLEAKCINNICTKTGGERPFPVNITWEEAKQLILSGQVKEVYQAHNLSVILVLKDDARKTTTEPQIDIVFNVVKQCGQPCSDIITATE